MHCVNSDVFLVLRHAVPIPALPALASQTGVSQGTGEEVWRGSLEPWMFNSLTAARCLYTESNYWGLGLKVYTDSV